jgi:hypothetical protein
MLFHGYMRAPDGTFTEVDVPGPGTGTYQGTAHQAVTHVTDRTRSFV